MTARNTGVPEILDRREEQLSPWFTVVEKDVLFPWLDGRQTYHAVRSLPYVAVYALTSMQTVPLLRQYRPAVEKYTWELPAGLMDADDSPEDTCRRELFEETGLTANSIRPLGEYEIDTGRSEGIQHLFFAECGAPGGNFVPEDGTEVAYVPEAELPDWVRAGRLTSLHHIAAISIARLLRATDDQP